MLVKDAIEFCDTVPLCDQRAQKTNDEVSQKSHDQVDIIDDETKLPSPQQIPIEQIIADDALQVLSNDAAEYVPQFTNFQRKQLDEQLRNVNFSI